MDETIQQHMMAGVYAIISVLIIGGIYEMIQQKSIKNVLPKATHIELVDTKDLASKTKPIIEIKDTCIKQYQSFYPLDYIIVRNIPEQYLERITQVYGNVNTLEKGLYHVTYVVKYDGVISKKETTFVVD